MSEIWSKDKMKILLFCPIKETNKEKSINHIQSIYNQILKNKPSYIECDLFYIETDPYPDIVNNLKYKWEQVYNKVKSQDYDYVLCIEEDIYPPADILNKFDFNYDILSGFYKFRNTNYFTITKNNQYINPYLYNGEIIEVDFTPFGCLLISKKAIIDIIPYMDWSGIDAEFSYIAKQKGYKLYAHTGIICSHYKKLYVKLNKIENILFVVPHFNITGGIRRCIEMAQTFAELGYNTYIYPINLTNYQYWGIAEYIVNDLNKEYDIAFFLESSSRYIEKVKSKAKVILVNSYQPEIYQKLYSKYSEDCIFIGCGSNWIKNFNFEVIGYTIVGGINTHFWKEIFIGQEVSNKFTILFPRKMDNPEFRGIPYIIETAKRLHNIKEVKENWEWIGFDTENIKKEFWKPLEEYNIKAIKIEDDLQLLSTYLNSDVVIYPIEYGIWNNICAEGMATGNLSMGTEFSTCDFLFNNITGIVIERNLEYIEKKFKDILDGKIDINKITNNGKEFIKQFDWQNVCLKILDVVLNKAQWSQ